MRKRATKTICLSLALVFCLSMFTFGIPALAEEDPPAPSLNKTQLDMLLGGQLFLLEVNDAPKERSSHGRRTTGG